MTDHFEEIVDRWLNRSSTDSAEKVSDYRKYIGRKLIFICVCILLAAIVAGYTLTIGAYDVDFIGSYETLWKHIIGDVTDKRLDYVIWDLRMPRICTGLLAGAGLGVCGVVMQSILRNPLADPYTTGISSGASFGASLAIVLGISIGSNGYAVVSNAFVFSLVPMCVIILVSKMKSASPSTMIMSGIAVMYIFNAITTVIKLYASPEDQASLFAWSVGSIDGSNWDRVDIMAAFVIVGVAASLLLSKRLNVISTGDESSRSMGVNANRMRILALLIVSLTAAGVVSFTGLIGFVGLVCPHIARIFVGSDNKYLIPASAALGMALLLFADVIGRSITANLPVGVITAFIGGPMFLYLIVRSKKEVW